MQASESSTQVNHVQRAAAFYLQRRWAVVRIPQQNGKPVKGPRDFGWYARPYSADDFSATDNIGLKTGSASEGLADVDLDCPEAVHLAPHLLPKTGLWSGREKNPRSHAWYIVDPPNSDSKNWIFAGKKPLELRCEREQTMVEPSVHPNEGDRYRWDEFDQPTLISYADLTRCCTQIAAGSLLVRLWQGEGNRHDVGLAVAGMLLGCGWTEEEAIAFVFAVSQVAGHRDPRDRVQSVRSTYRNANNGRRVQGIPTFVSCFPDQLAMAEKVLEWCKAISPKPHFWKGQSQTNGHTWTEQQQHTEPPPAQDDDPLDIFGDSALTGEPDFPCNLLPAPLRDFVTDQSMRLGVDPVMLAAPALAVTAAALPDAYTVQPKRHDTEWRESGRLWLGVVAESGEKKSPALATALAPLRTLEAQWEEEDRPLFARYAAEEATYVAKLRRAAADTAAGKSAHFPTKPERPPHRRKIIQDATIEALAGLLADNPEGMLAAFDELASWFNSFDAYRPREGRDRAHWLEAYNGGPQIIDRKTVGTLSVPNWGVSLFGMTQAGPLQRLAGKITDDGLPQRLSIFYAKPGGQEQDRAPDAEAKKTYHSLIAKLIALPATPSPTPYMLAEGAHTVRKLLGKRIHDLQALPFLSASLKNHLSKWPGLFARLLLLFHVANHAGSDAIPPTIPKSTAARVFKLLVNYFLPNAVRFHNELGHSGNYSHVRWIAGHILATPRTKITARDIGRAFREIRGDRRAIQAAMDQLALCGWVVPLETRAKDGPTQWDINPRVYEIFANRAEEEKARRAAAKERIKEAVRNLGLGDEDVEC